ncbi:hypothetical protein KFE25_008667 [Diacronema lutheri]|uniref:Uncharacterized protein n=1 Tax=Diacronema lutheri TaxID=2081491 RepID=A0A8J5XJC3_DIALT|nr:hypothetical protein KFE25_008667 [Diacronema lutheri]
MSERAEEAKQAGNGHLAAGEFVRALRSYTEAIELCQSRDHTLFSNRAFAFTKLGQYARAIVDADAAIQLAPTWSKGYFRRAEAFRLSGMPAQALQAYCVASRIDPSDEHLRACCINGATEVRRAARRGYAFVGVGLAIGLSVALALFLSESYAKGELSSSASLVLVALSLCTLGALGGAGARELYRHQLASRAAAPLTSNDAFVRLQFPDMRVPKSARTAAAGPEHAAEPGDDGAGARHRRTARPTNKYKAFRDRAHPTSRPPPLG